ncbi:hypothetical protein SAMN05443668_1364 [Cryptosporangium aurantiacum]|uniref:Uncharacterized protein n=2 Tax=Cryptosporangium aurantiacum TaxID=134849 RepID=A0A1M7RQ15_9ACTN|nr:hypothetical protein SAMN05443668_1364 [Cryptosporangium aurantiacum]
MSVRYDPTGARNHGTPTWPLGYAPAGLVTRRQLRLRGLCPGRGNEPVGQLRFTYRGRPCFAYLYRLDQARPKRTATPAVLEALDRAMAARRWCPTCKTHKPYCIPTSLGECPEHQYPDPATAPTSTDVRDEPAPHCQEERRPAATPTPYEGSEAARS